MSFHLREETTDSDVAQCSHIHHYNVDQPTDTIISIIIIIIIKLILLECR